MEYLIAVWLGAGALFLGMLAVDPVVRKYGPAWLRAWWEQNVIADVSDWKTDI